jgi:hypothetical protein
MDVARFGKETVKRLRDPSGAAVGSRQIGRQQQDAAKVPLEAGTSLVQEALARSLNLDTGDGFGL